MRLGRWLRLSSTHPASVWRLSHKQRWYYVRKMIFGRLLCVHGSCSPSLVYSTAPSREMALLRPPPSPSSSQRRTFSAVEPSREPSNRPQEGVYVTSARQLSHFSLE